MKRTLAILLSVLAAASCEKESPGAGSGDELVVEGWIEAGHAPIVMVSSTLPVSSTPRPVSDIQDHILRYAEVCIDHDGGREYLTACLSERLTLMNYFTSSTLRGKEGGSYRLHVRWRDFEASSVCTIPPSPRIDTAWFERERDDTSYVLRMRFRNDPSEGRFYQSFRRVGDVDTAIFSPVDFSALKGSQLGAVVEASYMKPAGGGSDDTYFHKGDMAAVKLCTMDESMYGFWTSFTNSGYGAGFSTMGTTVNLKGNVEGALGYWAGYGMDIREMVCE